MECEFNRILYKRRLDNYSGHKHLIASMQSRKYSKDTFKMKFGRTEDTFRSTRKTAILGYKELGGLSDQGPRDYAYDIHFVG
jgi:hypothetical protein